jgi:hypothetical protein
MRDFLNTLAQNWADYLQKLAKVAKKAVESLAEAAALAATDFAEIITRSTFISSQVLEGIIANVVYDVLEMRLGLRGKEPLQQRVEEARKHLIEASTIVGELQTEINRRTDELSRVLVLIDEKQQEAAHFELLASISEEEQRAMLDEMERRVRAQIRAELEKGKWKRLAFDFFLVILGAILGHFIPKWFIARGF